MIGTLNTEHKEVTIVGAGISGLILAEALDRAGWQVTLIEASDDAGGMIGTRQARLGPAETAAHAIQATPAVLALCARLGVELEAVRPGSRARYVWRGGVPRRMPLSVWELIRTLARAYAVLADSKVDPAHLTLEQWGRRHLGEAAVKYLLTPFVRGIYGARPSEINVRMVLPSLLVPRGHSLFSWMLRRWHLKLRGKGDSKGPRPEMMAPVNGMGALIQALETRLRERLGDRFKTGLSVRVLPHAKNIVLCVPASEAATILSEEDPALSQALDAIPHAPLVSVTAFTEREAFPSAPKGVGVLLPEGTSRKTLGVLYNSSSFSNRVVDESKWVSLTLMMGGTEKPETVHATDQELQSFTRDDLEKLYDLAPGAHLETVINRWERAIPLYGDGLHAAWDAARAGWCSTPGHVLFGNYTGQVSIRGMIETVSELMK